MTTTRKGITWTDAAETDAPQAMDAAIDGGYAELVNRDWYYPRITEATDKAYFTRSMGEAENAVFKRKSDGALLRCWQCYEADPKDFAIALERFRRERPSFAGTTKMAQELLRESNNGRGQNPRWQLQASVREAVFEPEDQLKLNVMRWGITRKDLKALETTQYDKNKAYLSSFTQANLAPAMDTGWTHYDERALRGVALDRKVSGMVKVVVPVWNSPLPNPAGNRAGGEELWTTVELYRLWVERGITPRALEAWLSPSSRVKALHKTAEEYKRLLEVFKEDKVCEGFVKRSYQSLAGSISSHRYSKSRPDSCYRPDWAMAIKDNSWANVCRMAYKVWEADNRFIPLAINIDAIYYEGTLETPPLLPIGDAIANYKKVEK